MSNSQVKIIAHRGASYIAPENTVASSKLAWKLGTDAVETDIYLTKDNKIICSHDANTKRASGQDYKIAETNSDVLRKLDVGSFKDLKYKGEKMPFLEDLIKVMPKGKELVVEIKCGKEVLPYLKSTIQRYGKNKVFTFIAFDLETITAVKKLFPYCSCYWLSSNAELVQQKLSLIPEAGLEGISLSFNIINEDIMRQAKNLNVEVCSWTIDDPEEAKRLISLGVNTITTNRPGWLTDQIK